jgi:hypothetical chaperone protein
MRIGIDFGTTNSGVAIYDGEAMHLFQVDDFLPDLLPSIIYITKQFAEHVGTDARELYLRQNVNRPSRFEKMYIGELEMWVSTHTSPKKVRMDVYAWNDVLAPGRLLKSVKTALRSKDYEGTRVFGQMYTLEQLIGIILGRLVQTVETVLGKPVTTAVLGRPVKFSDDTVVDLRAESLIAAGARLAGLEDVRFLPEPIAAAYTFHKKLAQRQTTLIFDFGGGTLDLTVAQLGGQAEPVILATEGVLIGGDDFDRRLFEHLLPHFGLGAVLPNGQPIPAYIWDVVLHWEAAEGQQMAEVIDFVQATIQSGQDHLPPGLFALEKLLTQNLQYKLLQEIVQAKIDLSQQESATIRFTDGGLDLAQTIPRSQFEALIQPEVARIAAALDSVMAKAAKRPEEVALVINTGGSSQIPVFSQLLAAYFPTAAISSETEEVLTGVVQGLAIFGHDLDEKLNGTAVPLKRQLVQQAANGQGQTAPQTSVKDAAPSHFVVGLNDDGVLAVQPWFADEQHQAQQADYWRQQPITQALFCGQNVPLLLGTLWSKFLQTTAAALFDPTTGQLNLPRHLQPDAATGDRYVLLTKWTDLHQGKLLVLVTQNGNIRYFQRHFVEKELKSYSRWELEKGLKPDIPAALLSADKADEVLLVSENGRAIRVLLSEISVRGQRALKLKELERIHALRLPGDVAPVVVSRNGRAVRYPLADIPTAPRLGGAGKQIVRGESICGLLPDAEQNTAFGLTSWGRLVELDLAASNLDGRSPAVNLVAGEMLLYCWPTQLGKGSG